MTRFQAAIRHPRQQKEKRQDAVALTKRDYTITTDGAVATPSAGVVSHYRTADGWREKDETGTASDVGGGGGGESGLLEDPGASYVLGGTVQVGDRIAETIDGALRVFEATVGGTAGEFAFADYLDPATGLIPLGVTATGATVRWRYLGIVGQLGSDVAPQFPGVLEDTDGVAIVGRHPWDDPDTLLRLLPALADPGDEWEALTAVSLGDRVTATVDGRVRVFTCADAGTTGAAAPAWLVTTVGQNTNDADVIWSYVGIVGGPDYLRPVFVMDSAGDADYYLDQDQGSGVRFKVAVNGVPVASGTSVAITTDGLTIFNGTDRLEIGFDPWFLDITGLPTSNPAVAGRAFQGAVSEGARPLLLSTG